ncbi:hypothetical protein F7725_018948 [Dissostichus mawsoni]|uniref:Uncharacterized protein n=1 Tax=Dissostichus mawsoni TaxID=36200 RepID=A0A7J5XTM2_DISMA|nr:hypothetical protein F7725_018948 [Dissostichus mawsoni]
MASINFRRSGAFDIVALSSNAGFLVHRMILSSESPAAERSAALGAADCPPLAPLPQRRRRPVNMEGPRGVLSLCLLTVLLQPGTLGEYHELYQDYVSGSVCVSACVKQTVR